MYVPERREWPGEERETESVWVCVQSPVKCEIPHLYRPGRSQPRVAGVG
jgi:hypothetical protein